MIVSKDNSKIKLIRALSSKKERDRTGLYFIEGKILVDEYLKHAMKIEFLIYSEEYEEEINLSYGTESFKVKREIFNSVSNTNHSQGIMAVVAKRETDLTQISNKHLILFVDGIQDPGNMGTIIRSADAFGVKGIIYNKGCVDIYNPKTVRAAMGSMTRTDFLSTEDDSEALLFLKSEGYQIFSAVVNCSTYIEDLNRCEKSVLVIGNESRGINEKILSLSDELFTIKMAKGSESLNAGVAAGICLYYFGRNFI
ncbi:MAG: RNA methyltransferase [Tissierellales bacterium]|nr:RNA methyltransferase [Tissierellales bacterium]MBN2827650.1 RNA methyltransferase [Tissierellales bacterium]